MLGMPPLENHVLALVKTLACSYATIKVHHAAKRTSESILGDFVRRTLKKGSIAKIYNIYTFEEPSNTNLNSFMSSKNLHGSV